MTATTELPIDTLPGKLLSLDSPSTLKTKPCSQQAPPTLMPLSLKNQNHLLRPSRERLDIIRQVSPTTSETTCISSQLLICLFCSFDQFLLFTATSVEFYFSNADLPFDKFMFLQTSTHLDSVIAPNLSAEAKKKAEGYGPGCFMSDEDLAKAGEPSYMQIELEQWASVAVLRMRCENDKPNGNSDENSKGPEKWENLVFIEYLEADSAKQLVHQFKQETRKPQFEGRELSSIMFKIDYVTMKANKKGLPAPKVPGKRQAGQPSQPTTNAPGSAGQNSSSFNAFRELKLISGGFKEYAGLLIDEADKLLMVGVYPWAHHCQSRHWSWELGWDCC
ncbi:hypothetical protein MJO28_000729 [Puccinia striiformis f. sp. tritici]|uniref:Uncharacterized protein n=1 Tax=Puccinia striiformis f. sp. tritici TaxID=168172 RepID=A0ACC0F0F6_9BASI|nr:hypothetical protein MJO28_000729 [Puccinia striiformis f. sp. tritici]